MSDPQKISLFFDEMIRLLQGGWIKGYLASDGQFPCNPLSEEAKCFCLQGAFIRANSNLDELPIDFSPGLYLGNPAYQYLMAAIAAKAGTRALSSFNDHVAQTGEDIANIILDAKELMYADLGISQKAADEAEHNPPPQADPQPHPRDVG